MFIKKYSTQLILALITLCLIWVSSNINWGKENWKGMLESDAKGYYAYLPATFVYQDLNFHFLDGIERKYKMDHIYYDYRRSVDGKLVNKYFVGTSVLQLPFFLTAHSITHLANGDTDGYSKWYMILINISSIFYHLLGLIFLARLFRSYKIRRQIINLMLLAASFGTNLFVYTIVEPGMSHVYSFSMIAAFLFYMKRYFTRPNEKDIIRLAFLLGLIVLIRPINGLVLFCAPLLAGNWQNLKMVISNVLQKPLFNHFKLILIFIGVLFIQLIAYQMATGSFFVYSYKEETFNFLDPHFIDILFSYKKGLFLYTPIYLMPLLLSYFIWKRSSFQFLSWLLFFILITYVLSSWWMWFYGGSFSSRVFVDYLAVFLFVLGIGLNEIKNVKLEYGCYSVIVLLIGLCQIQSYQYRYYIIHYSEMTKERYWDVFFQLSS